MHRDSLEILVRREREDHVASLAVLDPVDPMESVYVFLWPVFFPGRTAGGTTDVVDVWCLL